MYRFVINCGHTAQDSKIETNGQDAFYYGNNIIVVCDGVGGWNKRGINAGYYARELVQRIRDIYKSNEEYYICKPKQLIPIAVKNNIQVGSCTITIVTLNKITGRINSAHMGDSIFKVFKPYFEKYYLAYEAPEGQHKFNCPYQVGYNGDNLSLALELVDFKTEPRDVVVVGTDGLWDNVYDEEIMRELDYGMSIQQIAEDLSRVGYQSSKMEDYKSPFYKKAVHNGLSCVRRGKPDDITVIVAKIKIF